jgi:hypothetical protein
MRENRRQSIGERMRERKHTHKYIYGLWRERERGTDSEKA